jgi:hypothetical protein
MGYLWAAVEHLCLAALIVGACALVFWLAADEIARILT